MEPSKIFWEEKVIFYTWRMQGNKILKPTKSCKVNWHGKKKNAIVQSEKGDSQLLLASIKKKMFIGIFHQKGSIANALLLIKGGQENVLIPKDIPLPLSDTFMGLWWWSTDEIYWSLLFSAKNLDSFSQITCSHCHWYEIEIKCPLCIRFQEFRFFLVFFHNDPSWY